MRERYGSLIIDCTDRFLDLQAYWHGLSGLELWSLVGSLAAARVTLLIHTELYTSHMAAYVELFGLRCLDKVVILRVLSSAFSSLISICGHCGLRRRLSGVLAMSLKNDGVHAVHWPSILTCPWKEFLTADSAGDDIAH